jgi:hypothetical protein
METEKNTTDVGLIHGEAHINYAEKQVYMNYGGKENTA